MLRRAPHTAAGPTPGQRRPMYALLRRRVGRHDLLFPPQAQNPTQRLPRRPWVLSNPTSNPDPNATPIPNPGLNPNPDPNPDPYPNQTFGSTLPSRPAWALTRPTSPHSSRCRHTHSEPNPDPKLNPNPNPNRNPKPDPDPNPNPNPNPNPDPYPYPNPKSTANPKSLIPTLTLPNDSTNPIA